MKDTIYVKKGRFKEEIKLPEDPTLYNQYGFEINYINGKSVLTKNGLLFLGSLKAKFIETEKDFKWLSETNQLENCIRTGITKHQKEKVETNNEYSRLIYDALGGDVFINGCQDCGLLINSYYKFELKNKNELDNFRIMGLKLKKVGAIGTFAIVELFEEDIDKMKLLKFDVAKLADSIFDLSNYLLKHYRECIVLKNEIISNNQNSITIGGS